MLSIIVPSYRNPNYLDLCLKSLIENQTVKNEIIVVLDGFPEESKEVIEKYKADIKVLEFPENRGLQTALNFGVYNATNENILILNDDNIVGKRFDEFLTIGLAGYCLTINQVEPIGPSIYGFPIINLGKTPKEFDYNKWLYIERELSISMKHPFLEFTNDGGMFPFAVSKKNYMKVGGFDTLYGSPFVVDFDFFLKLELAGIEFLKTSNYHFYHFGSATVNRGTEIRATEGPAAATFEYKWGFPPQRFANNSHVPKGQLKKGVQY